jgi:hypothetical protein
MILEHAPVARRATSPTATSRGRSLRLVGTLVATTSLGLFLTACSSSSSSTTTTQAMSTTSTAATPTSGATQTTTPLTATDLSAINTTFNTIFDLGNTSASAVAARISLLQDGSQLSSALTQLASSPLAAGAIGASVVSAGLLSAQACTNEGLTSPCATVKFNILGGGTAVNGTTTTTVLLPGDVGYAIEQGTTWLLAKTTICSLISTFNLATTPTVPLPAVCSAA